MVAKKSKRYCHEHQSWVWLEARATYPRRRHELCRLHWSSCGHPMSPIFTQRPTTVEGEEGCARSLLSCACSVVLRSKESTSPMSLRGIHRSPGESPEDGRNVAAPLEAFGFSPMLLAGTRVAAHQRGSSCRSAAVTAQTGPCAACATVWIQAAAAFGRPLQTHRSATSRAAFTKHQHTHTRWHAVTDAHTLP